MFITIHVVNDGANVSDADVSIALANDGFRKGWNGNGSTEGDGTITFQLSNVRSGCYSTVVNSVSAEPSWDRAQPQDDGYCKP